MRAIRNTCFSFRAFETSIAQLRDPLRLQCSKLTLRGSTTYTITVRLEFSRITIIRIKRNFRFRLRLLYRLRQHQRSTRSLASRQTLCPPYWYHNNIQTKIFFRPDSTNVANRTWTPNVTCYAAGTDTNLFYNKRTRAQHLLLNNRLLRSSFIARENTSNSISRSWRLSVPKYTCDVQQRRLDCMIRAGNEQLSMNWTSLAQEGKRLSSRGWLRTK